ncbi:MAG: PDZ domain-containing protein [Dokdonella sp.]
MTLNTDIRNGPFLGLSLAVLVATSAYAQTVSASRAPEPDNTGIAANAEQRVREELRGMMLDMVSTGTFAGVAPENVNLQIDEPAQQVDNLGLLVDSSSARADANAGLRVLATTPGGAAERMGLRAGDVLVAVNGNSLASSDVGADGSNRGSAAEGLRRELAGLANGDTLHFSVHRSGSALEVSGPVARTFLPAMRLRIGNGTTVASATSGAAGVGMTVNAVDAASISGCGRISVFDVAPRNQQLHEAKLIFIDGVTPGPSGAKSYRVSAGRHTLTVSERIENRYLSINSAQRNAALNRYKTIDVDVAPDTTYFLAAHFNQDKALEFAHNEYWDPKIWREVHESCGAWH